MDLTPDEMNAYLAEMEKLLVQIKAQGKHDSNWIEPFWVYAPQSEPQTVYVAVQMSIEQHWTIRSESCGVHQWQIERKYKDPEPKKAPNFRGMA